MQTEDGIGLLIVSRNMARMAIPVRPLIDCIVVEGNAQDHTDGQLGKAKLALVSGRFYWLVRLNRLYLS